jgi:hypothetical protein
MKEALTSEPNTDHIAQSGRLEAPCDAAEAHERVRRPVTSETSRGGRLWFLHYCECKCGCEAVLPREQHWWRVCLRCGYRASIDGVWQLPGRGDWDTRCKSYVEPQPEAPPAPTAQLSLFETSQGIA